MGKAMMSTQRLFHRVSHAGPNLAHKITYTFPPEYLPHATTGLCVQKKRDMFEWKRFLEICTSVQGNLCQGQAVVGGGVVPLAARLAAGARVAAKGTAQVSERVRGSNQTLLARHGVCRTLVEVPVSRSV